jgi:hypothetical protein
VLQVSHRFNGRWEQTREFLKYTKDSSGQRDGRAESWGISWEIEGWEGIVEDHERKEIALVRKEWLIQRQIKSGINLGRHH